MNCKTLCVAFMLSLGMTFFAGNSQAEDEYVNFLLEEDEDSKGDAVSRVIKPYFNEKSIILTHAEKHVANSTPRHILQ